MRKATNFGEVVIGEIRPKFGLLAFSGDFADKFNLKQRQITLSLLTNQYTHMFRYKLCDV